MRVENNDDFVTKDGISYGCYEFYKVDLKSDVVTKCCPSLLSDVSKGCMVHLGSFIYIIDDPSRKNYSKVIHIQPPPYYDHKGASWIDLSKG